MHARACDSRSGVPSGADRFAEFLRASNFQTFPKLLIQISLDCAFEPCFWHQHYEKHTVAQNIQASR